MIPFREWLSQKTKPILKASVGVLTCLVVGLVIYSTLLNQKRAEESFQNWKRSAELLVQKRDLPTLQGVSEQFLDDLSGTSFDLRETTSLWRFPISESKNNLNKILFKKTKSWQWTMSTNPSVVASVKIPYFSIYKSTLTLCAFLFFILLSVFLFFKHLYSVIDKTLNTAIEGLAHENLSGVTELDQLVMHVRSSAQLQEKAESDAVIGRMAAQVAHDIASPLLSLEMMVSDTNELPESKRILIQSVATRVKKIVGQLRHRQVEKTELVQLMPFIELVILEKREQFRNRQALEIEVIRDPSVLEHCSKIQPIELTRIISNLINNSAQAIENSGRIEITLRNYESFIEICVKDNGKGIAPEILEKLGERGNTYGKLDGSGLGLYHARSTVKSWKGTLTLTSEVGAGTTVVLRFPTASTVSVESKLQPGQSLSPNGAHINATDLSDDFRAAHASPDVVLIDEDAMTHIAWQEAATHSLKKLQCLFSPELFSCYENKIDKNSSIFIDLRLGERQSGVAFAKQLHEKGFSNLYLLKGDADSIENSKLSWIKGIVGKTAPMLFKL